MTNRKFTKYYPVRLVSLCIAQLWITTEKWDCRRCTKTHGRSDSQLDQSRVWSTNQCHVSMHEPFAFKKWNSPTWRML